MLRLTGLASQTTYGATIYLGATPQGSRILLAETIAGQYEALPTGLAAGIYTVVFDNDGTEVARIVYESNGTAEVTNSVVLGSYVAPNNSGIGAIQTAVSGLATSTALTAAQNAIIAEGASWVTYDDTALVAAVGNIPTTPLLDSNYVAPDNAGISELTALLTVDNTAFTATALANAPAGGSSGGLTTVQNNQLMAIPTNNDLSAIATAVNSARDAVLTEGGLSWGTADSAAISTAVEAGLSTQLDAIELNAKIASEPITNRTKIDATQNTYTLYQDDGTTPRVVKNLTDENGSPNASRVFEEVPQ